jgi:hypothetical protein
MPAVLPRFRLVRRESAFDVQTSVGSHQIGPTACWVWRSLEEAGAAAELSVRSTLTIFIRLF